MIEENDFDLIHAHLFRMGQYVSGVDGIPKVLDLCDSLALNLERRAALDRSLKRPLVQLEANRVRRYEPKIAKLFDWGTVVSAFDQDYLLQQDTTLKLSIVPMGVDLEYFQPTSPEYQPHLLFTGTMSYFPNWDAALYFHREIFPRIQEVHPETVFYIVGNHPPEQIRRLANHENVVVTGHVPETRPYFEEAAVFVSPLRAGSGVQVKNLEAMAMGVPVVTTTVGAEGLEVNANQDLLVADTPEVFAKKVVDLIENPDFRQSVGSAGRKLVETKYNWQILGQRLEDVYSRVCHA
jgi:polysaccharide biosynthesis protein PslH